MLKLTSLAISLLTAISLAPAAQAMNASGNTPATHQASENLHAQIIIKVNPQIGGGHDYDRDRYEHERYERERAERHHRRREELARREHEARARWEAEQRRRYEYAQRRRHEHRHHDRHDGYHHGY
jgi:hypothetical protein